MIIIIELLIKKNDTSYYEPVVIDEIKWETHLKNQPGKLTFSVINDGLLNFQEGDIVRLSVDGVKLFYGFVFKKQRDKDNTIKVTAYDQLRYLKNKDTYVYDNKTASELVQMIASDFNLNVGTIDDTVFKIANKIEDNKSLFDIIQNALDLTLKSKRKLYVLYDDFGSLVLKDIENLKLDLMIDDETAENYNYTSSIDGQTYNKIKLSYANQDTGKRDIYISQDSNHINSWGVLQYFESIDESVNGKAKADALLKLYNSKTRNLTISGAFGDVRVRAGASIPIDLAVGDIKIMNYMIVEKVVHSFKKDNHTMNLTLKGGGINA